jgi:hypothetical protein
VADDDQVLSDLEGRGDPSTKLLNRLELIEDQRRWLLGDGAAAVIAARQEILADSPTAMVMLSRR